MEVKQLCAEAFQTSKDKGWYDNGGHTLGESISLMHSEPSEALEEYRAGNDPRMVYFKDGKPEGLPIELADVLIRIFDFCGARDIDLEAAQKSKMEYNKTREFRHGGKKL